MTYLNGNKEKIAISVVIGYIVVLGIGAIAEVFDFQPILDWSFWRPPGKY